ncbi:hypothetical protein ACV772_000033 [Proteus mirabilis]|nr:hypothetical protein [Proteus mirabilis]HEK3183511.1 hypothetical protein [Proteus mirabilis]
MLKFDKDNRLILDELKTLEDYLRALAYCNSSIMRIDAELDRKEDRYPEWATRAKTARKYLNWQRRYICDQLAILKRQRKEVDYSRRILRNEILVAELKKLITHKEFMQLVNKAETEASAQLVSVLEVDHDYD